MSSRISVSSTLEHRPIERTELLSADECGVAGTISELTLVEEIDGFRYDQNGLLSRVRKRYIDIMRGTADLPGIELVPLVALSRLSVADDVAVRAS